MFLICDELLDVTKRMIDGMVVNEEYVKRNLEIFAPFAATERILTAATKAGADRQETHEVLRKISIFAWETMQRGQPNPLTKIVMENETLNKYLSKEELSSLLDVHQYVGDAPERACQVAKMIRSEFERNNE